MVFPQSFYAYSGIAARKGQFMKDPLMKKYRQEKPDLYDIGLRYESERSAVHYFCTPKGADIFASLGVDGIHYCTIPSLGETVFVVTPSPLGDDYVYPVANHFREFLDLVVALHGTELIDQIPVFSRERLDSMLKEHIESETKERKAALEYLKNVFYASALPNPFDHVLALCQSFDVSKIRYTKEYYETLDIEEPR